MDTSQSVPQNITKSSFAAMAGVFFSRASGVVRTIVVNSTFGAATALDAFNAAFRLPNSLRDLFADGALSAAFMTTLVDEKQKGLKNERELIAIVFGFFGLVTLLIALLGAFGSHEIMSLITQNNFKVTGGLAIASFLFKFLIFYLPLTMVNAVVMAVLGVHGQSFRAMNGSIFLSVGMILGALALGPIFKLMGVQAIYGLAVGALLGALLQMIYQMKPLVGLNLLPFPNFNIFTWAHYPALKKILWQMAPRALGQGALVLALSINTFFATQIGTGYLTYIVTAVTIIQVPIGLFGVATGFAALPALSVTLTQNDSHNFSKLLVEGLRTSFWLATFTTICFALLVVPFYMVLFQHGKIVFADTINNSIAICMYATGIILASGNKLLLNSLYALDGTRQIVINAFAYLFVNTILNVLLVPTFGVIGIGFSFGVATSLDFWLNYFAVKAYFARRGFKISPYEQGGEFFTRKIIILNIVSFLICLMGVGLIQVFWSTFHLQFTSAFLLLAAGGAVFGAVFLLVVIKLGPTHLRNIFAKVLH